MKLLQLRQPDEDLVAMLCLTLGCRPTDSELVLECPDDLDGARYGLAPYVPAAPKWVPERAWLLAYKGGFHVYESVRAQLAKKGDLSEAQWLMIRRAVEREAARAVASAAPKTFSISAGTTFVVSKFIGEQIAQQAGLTRGHYGFKVLAVMRETELAYSLQLEFVACRTRHCSVCGILLKNPVSVDAGIGPICAENWGVDRDGEGTPLELLAEKLKTLATVVAWVPKKAIKERVENETKKSKPSAAC